MAKKASAKGSKKSGKMAKAAKPKGGVAAASQKTQSKYGQAGAPWWKQFLPG